METVRYIYAVRVAPLEYYWTVICKHPRINGHTCCRTRLICFREFVLNISDFNGIRSHYCRCLVFVFVLNCVVTVVIVRIEELNCQSSWWDRRSGREVDVE